MSETETRSALRVALDAVRRASHGSVLLDRLVCLALRQDPDALVGSLPRYSTSFDDARGTLPAGFYCAGLVEVPGDETLGPTTWRAVAAEFEPDRLDAPQDPGRTFASLGSSARPSAAMAMLEASLMAHGLPLERAAARRA